MRGIQTGLISICMLSTAGCATQPVSDNRSEACAVWLREASFADAVARHDAGAFAEHIDAHAVFLDIQGKQSMGPKAITAEWSDLLKGDAMQLRWVPHDIAIDPDRGLAASRGPYVVRRVHPEPGKPNAYGGTYSSFWIRGDDGEWRILFDAGSGPQPMTDEGEQQHMRVPTLCPY